mmetsp:Transcript_16575/g.28060  ORF Transcript_16575/g.28060 Transcript_16575/m.28060 type:complete len:203 (+) Transcript_16575:149-757(+)
MGSGTSTNNPANNLHKTESEIVKLMFPLYYSAQAITKDEHKLASDAWSDILNDKSPEFVNRKKTDKNFTYSSNVTFFYDTFYMRLFDIHPMSKNLFKNGMRSQGKFLVKMITLALSEINDGVKFDKTLVKLAEVHNERGVKAVECKIFEGSEIFFIFAEISNLVNTFFTHTHTHTLSLSLSLSLPYSLYLRLFFSILCSGLV